jgi:hypothetical protein
VWYKSRIHGVISRARHTPLQPANSTQQSARAIKKHFGGGRAECMMHIALAGKCLLRASAAAKQFISLRPFNFNHPE